MYLVGDNYLIVENFDDESIGLSIEFSKPVRTGKTLVLPGDGNVDSSLSGSKLTFAKITLRILVAIEYE